MARFCRDPGKPQTGYYERAHITSSEARLLLLRGHAAARVYAIVVATAMEAVPWPPARSGGALGAGLVQVKSTGRAHVIGASRLSERATPE